MEIHEWCFFLVFFFSEAALKKAPGNKLTKSNSLPGQNGNPTFAAVAAGYDKSPGELVLECCCAPIKIFVADTFNWYLFLKCQHIYA